MEITQALKDTENGLRDFIAKVLKEKYGDEWISQCGVSEDRVAAWKSRKEVESKRQKFGVVEERLLYYANFYDLKTILKKHWSEEFSEALGDLKTMEVWLSELEKLRDPDAHRREFLPHQKHLAIGVAGEIRNRIIRYRSKQETEMDCFPRIESARDSLGNLYTPGKYLTAPLATLRVGDTVEYVITATDPLGEPLEYSLTLITGVTKTTRPGEWRSDNEFSVTFAKEEIGIQTKVFFQIRSKRDFHANGDHDESVLFIYTVLPLKQ